MISYFNRTVPRSNNKRIGCAEKPVFIAQTNTTKSRTKQIPSVRMRLRTQIQVTSSSNNNSSSCNIYMNKYLIFIEKIKKEYKCIRMKDILLLARDQCRRHFLISGHHQASQQKCCLSQESMFGKVGHRFSRLEMIHTNRHLYMDIKIILVS